MEASNRKNNEDGANEGSPSKLSSQNLPIPDITILRLNYWVEDTYDQVVLQAFRNNSDVKVEDSKSATSGRTMPKDILLCSGYEIERKDILECKHYGSDTDPLLKKGLNGSDSDNYDTVVIPYNVNEKVKVILRFNDFSRSDEKSICWSNRYIWLLRSPVQIYEAKDCLYIILAQKQTAPPSLHLRFKMNLSEELASYNIDCKSSDDSSAKSINLGINTNNGKISAIEKEIFKAVCINLELFYTLFLCCPRDIISKSPIASSTQKILLIDDAHNPVHALNCAKFLVKNTCNHILILLLENEDRDKQHKKKKKKTDSESEKRLDFDEDLKTKSQVKLESLINSHSSSIMMVSQADDKNYIDSFEEAIKSFAGSGGVECAIDFRKSTLLDTNMGDGKLSIGNILYENMGFNSTVIIQPDQSYAIDPSLVMLMSKKCINISFRNFTTFLCSTKYDLEILSFLTQIVRNEKDRISTHGGNEKVDDVNETTDDMYEVASYYK